MAESNASIVNSNSTGGASNSTAVNATANFLLSSSSNSTTGADSNATAANETAIASTSMAESNATIVNSNSTGGASNSTAVNATANFLLSSSSNSTTGEDSNATSANGTATANLQSVISLSQILNADPQISTIGNVNIINAGDDRENVALCYMPYLFSFEAENAIGIYEGMASVALAMEHLNTGNGTIIPELDGLNQRCPLKFVSDAFDIEAQKSVAVDTVIELTDRSRQGELIPCAILGAERSSISIPTSMIASLRGFPQISPISTSTELDDKSQYKLFGRTVPNDDGTAIPLLAKLVSWGVRYFAVLHSDDSYGNAFARGIRSAALNEASIVRVETFPIEVGADNQTISAAIKQLKDLQFTYFFGIIWGTDANNIMTEAYNQGIAGTGKHSWIFSDSMGSHVIGKNYSVGSPLEKAFRGTSVLLATGGIPGVGLDRFDKLATSIQVLGENEPDRSYLDGLYPKKPSVEIFVNIPGLVATFLYDAVVAIGLASCGLVNTTNEINAYNFTGESLYAAILNTTFAGTSGSVVLDPVTGTRHPLSALFSLTNFVDDEDAVVGSDVIQFKGIGTDLFKSGDWVSLHPFTFNDGTVDIPPDLPALKTNENYLSTGLKAVGLTLCGFVILLALGFSYWTFYYSNKRIVRSSQPLFLYLISAGTLLMGMAIIPLSIDQKGADAACMSFPWLLTIGFSLTFSALSTKTYRINRIMQSAKRFQRIKITSMDVIKPMVALLMINIIVLTVWTVIDPLHRETVVVTQDPFDRNTETYGICSSDQGYVFLATLGTINFGCLVFAVLQAYHARSISTELQESSYIFTAMAFILVVSFIGIPVLVVAQSNVNALYFIQAGLIFVICTSILTLIFIPKIVALRKSKLTRSASFASISRHSEDEGIKVMNSPMVIVQMEEEIKDLKRLLEMQGTRNECSNDREDAKSAVDDPVDGSIGIASEQQVDAITTSDSENQNPKQVYTRKISFSSEFSSSMSLN